MGQEKSSLCGLFGVRRTTKNGRGTNVPPIFDDVEYQLISLFVRSPAKTTYSPGLVGATQLFPSFPPLFFVLSCLFVTVIILFSVRRRAYCFLCQTPLFSRFHSIKSKVTQKKMDFLGTSGWGIQCQIEEKSDLMLLGSKYSFGAPQNKHTPQSVRLTLGSLLWMSYRSGFQESIGGLTTDAGWGCMYRSAQMMLGNLLLKHISPSSSSSPSVPFSSSLPQPTNENYQQIAQLFLDTKDSPYSMQKLVPLAEMILNRKSGEWIAPSEALQVLSIALQEHPHRYHSPLFPYMVRDGLMFANEVVEMSIEFGRGDFCPTMVTVPVRLGLDQLNDVYTQALKSLSFLPFFFFFVLCFQFSFYPLLFHCPHFSLSVLPSFPLFPTIIGVFALPQHVGIIGGQPRSSFFFIGTQDNNLFYLDPHTVQPTPVLSSQGSPNEGRKLGEGDLNTFFPNRVGTIAIPAIDPSMALCFYCPTLGSFQELVVAMREDGELKKLFSVEMERGADCAEEEEGDLCEFDMDEFKDKPKQTVIIGEDDDEFVLM